MNEQVLTIEQCKELITLGVDMSKASMCWYGKIHFDTNDDIKYIPEYSLGTNEFYSALYAEHPDPDDAVEEKEICVPTFTMQDILDRLPNTIKWKNKQYNFAVFINGFGNKTIGYRDEELWCLQFDKFTLQGVYRLYVWCLTNELL